MPQRGSQWTDFREVWYGGSFTKFSISSRFGWNRTTAPGALHEDLSTFVVTSVQDVLQIDNIANATYLCVSMATLYGFMLFTAKCKSATIKRELIVAFRWQHWLRERITTSRYTCIAYLVWDNEMVHVFEPSPFAPQWIRDLSDCWYYFSVMRY